MGLFKSLEICFVFIGATLIGYVLVLLGRSFLSAKRSLKNKTQLKSLLEGFDLDIPDELKDFDTNILNKMRTN